MKNNVQITWEYQGSNIYVTVNGKEWEVAFMATRHYSHFNETYVRPSPEEDNLEFEVYSINAVFDENNSLVPESVWGEFEEEIENQILETLETTDYCSEEDFDRDWCKTKETHFSFGK